MRFLLPWAVIGMMVMNCHSLAAQDLEVLPGTERLSLDGDITSHLVEGVDRFLVGQLGASIEKRQSQWPKPTNAVSDYEAAITPLRLELRHRIGMRDGRLAKSMTIQQRIGVDAVVAQSNTVEVYSVRWDVFEGLQAEGLLLLPKGSAVHFIGVVIPDAGQSPSDLCSNPENLNGTNASAFHLAGHGGAVIVPNVISRHREARNGQSQLTDQEYLYRTAFELGRHILGHQVQESLAAVDLLEKQFPGKPVMVGGWGEGGWIALHAAAVDPRIQVACVSGHFGPRENIWNEPIHRNVHGLLRAFGDAQLAALIAPRNLIIDAIPGPSVDIPGQGGAPGKLEGPAVDEVCREADIAGRLLEPWNLKQSIQMVEPAMKTGSGMSEDALAACLAKLSIDAKSCSDPIAGYQSFWDRLDSREEQRLRTLKKWDRYQQSMLDTIHLERNNHWSRLDTTSLEKFKETIEPYRAEFRDEIIGRWELQPLPPKPRSRLVYDQPTWRGYEVVLDVFPEVIAYGVLLLPKDAKPNDRRPCVVFQHGLEGRPKDVIEGDHYAYHDVAAKLCEQGYVVFAPQNLYIFEDRFRTLQRKSNPLGKTLFSTIVPQHQQIVDWLKTLSEVDPQRIAFYGLSYGGKSAMRIPALVPDYCLSICSADFNDWVWKNASTSSPFSYVWTKEYEIFEFDLGPKFNYAEMAALIAPRPFMVERGHFDTVAPDERVGLEYARVQNLYAARLGLADKTRIEWFVGPHTVNGKGTFEFLKQHLSQ